MTATTTSSQVPAGESQILVESLQVAGWPLRWMERLGNLSNNSLSSLLRGTRVSVERRDKIRALFLELRDLEPPQTTREQKHAVALARTCARKSGVGRHPSELPAVPWVAEVLSA